LDTGRGGSLLNNQFMGRGNRRSGWRCFSKKRMTHGKAKKEYKVRKVPCRKPRPILAKCRNSRNPGRERDKKIQLLSVKKNNQTPKTGLLESEKKACQGGDFAFPQACTEEASKAGVLEKVKRKNSQRHLRVGTFKGGLLSEGWTVKFEAPKKGEKLQPTRQTT